MLGRMMDFPLNVTAIVRRGEQYFADRRIASRRADRSWESTTYGELVGRARRVTAAMRDDLGLVPGDRVATLCWNHGRHLELYLGGPSAGLVVHTLNLRLHPDDLAYIAGHGGARVLVADKTVWQLVDAFAGRAGFEHLVAVGDGPTPDGAIEYEELVGRAPLDADPFFDVGEWEAAAMCYTSGTTGKPKGVVYSHRALALHTLGSLLPNVVPLTDADVFLPVVPMFHANAWGFPFSCALTGAMQVMPGPHLDPVSLLDAFVEHGVTHAAGVPTIWMGILTALDTEPERWDLSRVRMTIVGGAAAPRSLIAGLARHGIPVIQGWGMTETTPIGSTSAPTAREAELTDDERLTNRAKQGMALPFVEMRARGEDGFAPWDGVTMGELEVRGPWVAASYHEAPGSEERWTDDGWFKTGDVVTIEPDGFMTITDREKDLVKSGGEWISTVALENALMGHPSVAEAAVIAIPDDKWSERPLAVVVLRDGAVASLDELRTHLASQFAKWWLPDRFEFVDEIPKTAVGKFRKTALRERFGIAPLS